MGYCWSAPSPTPPAPQQPQASGTFWVPVKHFPVEEKGPQHQEEEAEEEEDEEEQEDNCTYTKLPPLPHPDYNPWPWSPGLPCPAEVEYWSETNGVVLTEAQLQAWEKIAKEYNLKNEY
jgi:hypothetical protein